VFIFCILYLWLNQSEEEEVQTIIQYWIRVLNIKLGWIQDFDKLVAKYVSLFYFCFYLMKYLFTTNFIMLEMFLSSKLLKNFTGHTDCVRSIDYSEFDGGRFICSGAQDSTICVWDVETNQQIQSFNGHSDAISCLKFSPYHYHNRHQDVICSSSNDNTICFWDFTNNKQLQIFNGHTDWIGGIKFSSFNGGRYLCSGSGDKTIRLWDVETSNSLHVFNEHENCICCVDTSPLQSDNNNNNNDNKSNNIGVIGGNGYTICSGSLDKTIRMWDIETTKQLIVFEGHESGVRSVKYGSNELRNIGANTILSGSYDNSIRLWDVRSGKQIQVFNGHRSDVWDVEYSPFVIKSSDEVVGGNSNVICSGSTDNTIRFWDIRSNKELYIINVDDKNEGIYCLRFLQAKEKGKKTNSINLCYGSGKGNICVWG
ncbi:WD-40 repeat protein, partial [Reticulomyxa filosa]